MTMGNDLIILAVCCAIEIWMFSFFQPSPSTLQLFIEDSVCGLWAKSDEIWVKWNQEKLQRFFNFGVRKFQGAARIPDSDLTMTFGLKRAHSTGSWSKITFTDASFSEKVSNVYKHSQMPIILRSLLPQDFSIIFQILLQLVFSFGFGLATAPGRSEVGLLAWLNLYLKTSKYLFFFIFQSSLKFTISFSGWAMPSARRKFLVKSSHEWIWYKRP